MLNRFNVMRGSLFLKFYNAAIVATAPFIWFKKGLKFRSRQKNYEWDMSRWWIPRPASEKAASGPSIAFLALGWAEVQIISQITRRLEEERSDLNFVWMLRDPESQEMARKMFPERQIVPMPFDFRTPAKRFFKIYKPNVLIVIEKFWWPNLVWGAKLAGAQVVLVNGRSRGRQKLRYKLLSGFQKWVLGAFDLLLFESDAQAERLKDVLPREVQVLGTGNVKWSFEIPKPPPNVESLKKWTILRKGAESGPLPILAAGSTSEGDEEWVFEAWEKVRQERDCVLMLAPRLPERARALGEGLREKGYRVSLRSQPLERSEILLLDTMGELSYAYRYGTAAYVGGAVTGRGHNIIEPLHWGIPVAYGPNRGDFETAQKVAEEWGVGFRVQNSEQLAEYWKAALHPDFGNSMRIRIEELLESQRHALDLTVESILALPFMREHERLQ